MMCQKCQRRPGTETWSESPFAYAHGLHSQWCKVCVLEAQLEHARKMAAQIPDLEQQLQDLS